MPNMITNNFRIENADLFKNKIHTESVYAFIGKSTEWTDESNPTCSLLPDSFILQTKSDTIGFKKIGSNNTCSMVRRIDWESGSTYDFYSNSVNQVDEQKSDGSKYNFYVRNSENNIYLCISNANGLVSTKEPKGKSLEIIQTSDGYIWKYLYTISETDFSDYATADFMPVYTKYYNDSSEQWAVQETAESGKIYFVEIKESGSDYNPSSPPAVTFIGDGTGAEGVVEIDEDTLGIKNIKMTSFGSGYSNCIASIDGLNQSASLAPVVSTGAKDARNLLGGTYLTVSVEIDSDDFDLVEYRQCGIVDRLFTNTKSKAIKVSAEDSIAFKSGDKIIGNKSAAKATVSNVDRKNGMIYLSNVSGNFVMNETITNNTNSYVALVENLFQSVDTMANTDTVLPYIVKDYNFLYVVNRTKIVRKENQKETLLFTLSF